MEFTQWYTCTHIHTCMRACMHRYACKYMSCVCIYVLIDSYGLGFRVSPLLMRQCWVLLRSRALLCGCDGMCGQDATTWHAARWGDLFANGNLRARCKLCLLALGCSVFRAQLRTSKQCHD